MPPLLSFRSELDRTKGFIGYHTMSGPAKLRVLIVAARMFAELDTHGRWPFIAYSWFCHVITPLL
jgi:hypothetical protein